MIDIIKIQNSLVGLVGYRQPTNPDYAIIDDNNLISESGYFVTDNPYAKIELIKSSQDYLDVSNVQFNDFLRQIKKSSASNVCNQVFSSADYIDRNVFYKNAFNKINVETLATGFYGFRIRVSDEKNVAFKVTRVLLDFQGTGTIKLVLWNNSKLEPLQIKEVEIVSDHQEEILDWVVNNTDTTYKGEYFMGALYDSTSGLKPYKRDWNDANLMSYIT